MASRWRRVLQRVDFCRAPSRRRQRRQARRRTLPGYYPPALTGLRGNHPGSFEAAHALRDSEFWSQAAAPIETNETYDLVIVGGGISGLAAAHFYRAERPEARILILDNHDDIGGHAKRNEFALGGRLALMNGGTYWIDSPRPYSKIADGLLRTLGVDPVSLEQKMRAAEFLRRARIGARHFL